LTKLDYLENTFSLEDIFGHETIIKLQNSSNFHLEEIKTLCNGRIFAVCPLNKFKAYERIHLYLTKDTEFEIAFFREGEEFLFNLPRFPMQTTVATIDTQKMQSADLTIAELNMKYMSKDLSPCNDYESKENNGYDAFVACARDKLRMDLKSTIPCTLPGFEDILGENFGNFYK